MADLIPPRRDGYFTPDGLPSLRFIRYLEDLAGQTNINTISSVENSDNSSIRAELLALRQQVGSGNALTWDETGFTWDSTKHSFDQTEA